jgi:hypothetical protein
LKKHLAEPDGNDFNITVVAFFIVVVVILGSMFYLFTYLPSTQPYPTGYFPTYQQKIKIGVSLPYPHKIGMYEDRVYTGYFDNDTIVICQSRTNYFIHIGGDLCVQDNSGNYLYHFVSIEKPSGNLVIEMISTD